MKLGEMSNDNSQYHAPDQSSNQGDSVVRDLGNVWKSINELKQGQIKDSKMVMYVIGAQLDCLSNLTTRVIKLSYVDRKALRIPYTELVRLSNLMGRLSIALSSVYFLNNLINEKGESKLWKETQKIKATLKYHPRRKGSHHQ